MSHLCPVPGCDVRIVDALLMCAAHWSSVPKPLRDAVSTTWDRYCRAVATGEAGRKQLLAEYIAAREAAIDAVAVAEGSHAVCICCGCMEGSPCCDAHEGATFARIDRDLGIGVCSCCPFGFASWDQSYGRSTEAA